MFTWDPPPRGKDGRTGALEDQSQTPPPQRNNNIPPWLTAAIIAAVATMLLINVFLDYHSAVYDGQGESVILAGFLGAALGLETVRRGK